MLGILSCLLWLTACTVPGDLVSVDIGPPPVATPPLVPQQLVNLPLSGPVTLAAAEISGMAWYGDILILLPQFPQRFGLGDGAFLVLTRQEIDRFLDGVDSQPLVPRPLPIETPGLGGMIPGYEGFESIAFVGERVYATVEADMGNRMLGWILAGEVVQSEGEMLGLRFDVEGAMPIEPQASIHNMTDESILVVPDPADGTKVQLITFYEANGRLVNARPVANRFSEDLTPLEPIPFVNVDYRITDVGELTPDGRFWAINYFFPGDVRLLRNAEQLGKIEPVEQLLEFSYSQDGIRRTETRPIRFALLPDGTARNWEGLVMLGDRGFLVVTDRFPTTILAFVPRP